MNAPYSKPASWHAERLTGIGGSDANIILSGDPERVMRLYGEKIGATEPENLEWVLPVQMGSATEELNCAFFAHVTGREVWGRNQSIRVADRIYMRCELDGQTLAENGEPAILECKHVNAFSTVEDVVQRYMPQLHHNMHCAGVRHAVLSIFIGTFKHEIFEVAMDDFYLIGLLDAEEAFWSAVTTRTPPIVSAPIASPVPFEKLRDADMTGSNEWASNALDWLTNKDAAKAFDKAAKEIKGLVDADVGNATGHGIEVKRSKSGSLTIKAEK